jgi:hypothetical protein
MAEIFISYRRDDSPDTVERIYDNLRRRFGKSKVFKDLGGIDIGEDFRSVIEQALTDCKVVLAVIGPGWLDAKDKKGNNRLSNPKDLLRIELETAIARKIKLIPVLVRNADMPEEKNLPRSLSSLAYIQALSVRRDPDFANDFERLARATEKSLSDSPKWAYIGALVVAIALLTATVVNKDSLMRLLFGTIRENCQSIPVTDSSKSPPVQTELVICD